MSDFSSKSQYASGSVYQFHENRLIYFTEIRRLYDIKNRGHLPSWIFDDAIILQCKTAYVFTVLTLFFTVIGFVVSETLRIRNAKNLQCKRYMQTLYMQNCSTLIRDTDKTLQQCIYSVIYIFSLIINFYDKSYELYKIKIA